MGRSNKGLSLDEFKEALSSDARDENEKLKEELKKLKKESSEQIKSLQEDVENYKKQCTALANRCHVFTQGLMCLNCQIDAELCEYAFTESELEMAANYMVNNKMPRTEETRAKMTKFLENLKHKRLNKKEK